MLNLEYAYISMDTQLFSKNISLFSTKISYVVLIQALIKIKHKLPGGCTIFSAWCRFVSSSSSSSRKNPPPVSIVFEGTLTFELPGKIK